MTNPFNLPPFPPGFPLHENCDPTDPYQALLWMLPATPAPKRNPLHFPLPFWQLMAKRLWDLGARPSAQPILDYQPEPNPTCMFAPGKFLPESPVPKPFPFEFPERENCDPGNPYHCFVWMFAGPPGMERGGPLLLGADELQLFSKQLWDLGARPDAEPLLRYERPTWLQDDWLTSPGHWIPVDEKVPG